MKKDGLNQTIKEQLAKANCSTPIGGWRNIMLSTVLTKD